MSLTGRPATTPPIREIGGAVLRPTAPGELFGVRQRCAVYGPDGRPVEEAIVRARLGDLSMPAPPPAMPPARHRAGRWLFGGIAYPHFGHALIFGTSRLWALDVLEGTLDGILFFDRGTGETREGTGTNMTRLLEAFGIALPVVTVAEPEVVERLVVPGQGISTTEALFCGTPGYRAFIRRIVEGTPVKGAGADVYVSRTGLGPTKAGLLFEERIEARLARAGYRVFHPERHDLAEQIAVYRGARRILGVDGSAMHVAAFAASREAAVGVLGRRAFYPEALAAQVRSFSGARAEAFHAFNRIYAPKASFRDGSLWFRALCEPEFPELSEALAASGFLDPGTLWRQPGPRRVRRRVRRLPARRFGRYRLVPDDIKASEPGRPLPVAGGVGPRLRPPEPDP
ncbi:MAG: glycosyltransferase 61 family protein [Pseudomonadota bacterium]